VREAAPNVSYRTPVISFFSACREGGVSRRPCCCPRQTRWRPCRFDKGVGFNVQFAPLAGILGKGATGIPEDLAPRHHVFYADRVVDVADDLRRSASNFKLQTPHIDQSCDVRPRRPKYARLSADYSKIPHESLPALSPEELEATKRCIRI